MATVILLPTTRPQGILNPMPLHQQKHRRIRFAPLPDPRRSVLITDDGSELPFPHLALATQFPAPPTPSPIIDPHRSDYFTFDNASMSSSSSSSKRNSDLLYPSSSSSSSSTPGTATPVSITLTTPSESSVPPSPVSCPPSPFAPSLNTNANANNTNANANNTNNNSSAPAPGPSPKPRSLQSLFRSLKRNSTSSSSGSSTTLTPVQSIDRTPTPTFSRRNFSAEEILTLGTINLFRASSSSRETSDTEGSGATPSSSTFPSWSLTRWTSGGSSQSHNKEPNWGSPLARASSTQSYQSPSKSKSAPPPSAASRKKGLRPVSRKGTRMLNGRVYGVKRNANPFANARDEEPTFVEWGYGGMGSVKGATSAGAQGWERLHGSTLSSRQSRDGEDDDAGSGVAWIKKRREQKEKERLEKEEKEREEREALEKAESADTQMPLLSESTSLSSSSLPPSSSPSMVVPTLVLPPLERKESATRLTSRPGTASSAKTVVSAASSLTVTPCTSNISTPLASSSLSPLLSVPTPPTPGSSRPGTAVSTPGEHQEHLMRAVNVPAPTRYHHHRPHSRGGSKDFNSVVVEADSITTPQNGIEEKELEERSRGNGTSESESESDVEREDEDSEEEESEEEEGQKRRKTALGAGVEKISRHH